MSDLPKRIPLPESYIEGERSEKSKFIHAIAAMTIVTAIASHEIPSALPDIDLLLSGKYMEPKEFRNMRDKQYPTIQIHRLSDMFPISQEPFSGKMPCKLSYDQDGIIYPDDISYTLFKAGLILMQMTSDKFQHTTKRIPGAPNNNHIIKFGHPDIYESILQKTPFASYQEGIISTLQVIALDLITREDVSLGNMTEKLSEYLGKNSLPNAYASTSKLGALANPINSNQFPSPSHLVGETVNGLRILNPQLKAHLRNELTSNSFPCPASITLDQSNKDHMLLLEQYTDVVAPDNKEKVLENYRKHHDWSAIDWTVHGIIEVLKILLSK